MRKTLSVLVFAVLGFCAFGAGQQAAAPEKGKEKQVVLRFSWWGGDERAKATLAVIKNFQEKYPNIVVKPEYGSSDGYNDKISTQLTAGTAPDIIQLANTMPQIYKGQGADYFIDLAKAGFDFSRFDPAYLAKANNGNLDGVQVGVPTGVAGGAFLINKDLAEKCGVAEIANGATWDELIEAGKKVHEKYPDVYLLCANTDYIINLIVKPYFNQITGNSTFADEKAVRLIATQDSLEKAMRLVQALYQNNVVPPAAYSAAYQGDKLQTDPNWIAGKYVAACTYISMLQVMSAANKNASFTVGELPVAKKGELLGWNTNCPQIIAVNKRSPNAKEAALFLNYFFNDPLSAETLGTVRSVPPTAEARKILSEKGIMDPLMRRGADISLKNKGVIADRWSESSEGLAAFRQSVEVVGYGASDPAKAAANLLKLLQGLVK